MTETLLQKAKQLQRITGFRDFKLKGTYEENVEILKAYFEGDLALKALDKVLGTQGTSYTYLLNLCRLMYRTGNLKIVKNKKAEKEQK